MRQLSLLLLFVVLQYTHAQRQTPEDAFKILVDEKARLLSDYRCTGDAKAVSEKVFRAEYRKIFSTVILNSNDIITNGSAFSYTAADKSSLSTNFSMFLSKESNRMLDIGLNIKNDQGAFVFYNKDGFAQNISLRAGLVIPILKRSMSFDREDCEENVKKRRVAMDRKLLGYKTALIQDRAGLFAKKALLEKRIAAQTTLLSNTDTTDHLSTLDTVVDQIKNLDNLLEKSPEALRAQIKKDVDDFDAANLPFTGYLTHWLNLSCNLSNYKPAIANDSIIVASVTEKIKGIYRYSFEASYNMQCVSKRKIFYFQASLRFNEESLIDNPFFKDKKTTVVPITQSDGVTTTTTGYLIAGDGEVFGNYNQLEAAQRNYDAGILLNWFGPVKKTIGLSFKGNYNFPAGGHWEFSYRHNYTSLLGISFRSVNEAGFGKATFSIQGGFEDIPIHTKAWDQFLVKLSVGVPFSIFSKK